jgi:hypothetical protein
MPYDDNDPTGIESGEDQSQANSGGGDWQGSSGVQPDDAGNYSNDPNAYDSSQKLLDESIKDDSDYEHQMVAAQRQREEAHERKWQEANRPGLEQVHQRLQALKQTQASRSRSSQQAQQQLSSQQTGNPYDIPGMKTKAMVYLALAVPAAILFGSRHGSGGWARAVGAVTAGLHDLTYGNEQQANQSYANWQQASKNVYNENFEQLGQYKEVLGDPRLGMDAKMRMIADKASFYRDAPLQEAARANDVNTVEKLLNDKETYLASYHRSQKKLAADLPGFQHPGGHRGRGAQYENYARDYQQRFGKDPDEDPDAASKFSYDQFRHPPKQQGQKKAASRSRGADYEKYAHLYQQKFGKDPDQDGNGSKWSYDQYIKESSSMKNDLFGKKGFEYGGSGQGGMSDPLGILQNKGQAKGQGQVSEDAKRAFRQQYGSDNSE